LLSVSLYFEHSFLKHSYYLSSLSYLLEFIYSEVTQWLVTKFCCYNSLFLLDTSAASVTNMWPGPINLKISPMACEISTTFNSFKVNNFLFELNNHAKFLPLMKYFLESLLNITELDWVTSVHRDFPINRNVRILWCHVSLIPIPISYDYLSAYNVSNLKNVYSWVVNVAHSFLCYQINFSILDVVPAEIWRIISNVQFLKPWFRNRPRVKLRVSIVVTSISSF